MACGLYTMNTGLESGNIFGAGTPGGTTSEDAAYELGTQFQSTVNATITALRVWCPTGGPSNYTAHLWNAGGALLATVTIPATANAWAQANLNPTVNITANTTYVTSYEVAAGQAYQINVGALANPITNGNLTALAGGGVYSTTEGTFPTQTYDNSCYYADVVDSYGACAAPTFNPAAGAYGPAQSVTISTTTGGATINYTTNGTVPSSTVGTVYSSPVAISATSTLQAIALRQAIPTAPSPRVSTRSTAPVLLRLSTRRPAPMAPRNR